MKGIGFANVRHFVADNFDWGAWGRVLDEFSGGEFEDVAAAIAIGWYDVSLFAKLLRAVDKVCGNGDLKLLRQVGAYEADRDLNRIHGWTSVSSRYLELNFDSNK